MSRNPLLERIQSTIASDSLNGTCQRVHSELGLVLLCERAPTQFEASIYEPVVCLILQGAKKTTIGDQTRVVSAGEYIVVSHDLPVLARVTQASRNKPYLAVIIELNLTVLRSLYDEVDHTHLETAAASSMEVASIEPAIEDVVGRYLDLRDDRVGGRVLLPLVQKELHFRLLLTGRDGVDRACLQGESGAFLLLERSHRSDAGILEVTRALNAQAGEAALAIEELDAEMNAAGDGYTGGRDRTGTDLPPLRRVEA